MHSQQREQFECIDLLVQRRLLRDRVGCLVGLFRWGAFGAMETAASRAFAVPTARSDDYAPPIFFSKLASPTGFDTSLRCQHVQRSRRHVLQAVPGRQLQQPGRIVVLLQSWLFAGGHSRFARLHGYGDLAAWAACRHSLVRQCTSRKRMTNPCKGETIAGVHDRSTYASLPIRLVQLVRIDLHW